MIALPPPPPAHVRCIEPETAERAKIKSFIVVRGDEEPVQTWLSDAVARGAAITEDWHEAGRRDTTVLLPSNTAYHTIGALIYSGQASGLSVIMETQPPTCGAETK